MTKKLSMIKKELKEGIEREILKDAKKLDMAERLLSQVNQTFMEAYKQSLSNPNKSGSTALSSGAVAMKLARSISEIRLIKESLKGMVVQ